MLSFCKDKKQEYFQKAVKRALKAKKNGDAVFQIGDILLLKCFPHELNDLAKEDIFSLDKHTYEYRYTHAEEAS
ncbi:hypothetical protein GLN3_05220 [Geobacillus lituanicus]|nr:hypothetical protein GLN3_05220 [Geobacillus lituanicus]